MKLCILNIAGLLGLAALSAGIYLEAGLGWCLISTGALVLTGALNGLRSR